MYVCIMLESVGMRLIYVGGVRSEYSILLLVFLHSVNEYIYNRNRKCEIKRRR